MLRVASCSGQTSGSNWERWGGNWLRFGDLWLVYAEEDNWAQFSAKAQRNGLQLQSLADNVRREEFGLVIQKGCSFQRAHPDVEILLHKGRYLLTRLRGEQSRFLAEVSAHYKLLSPSDNTTVYQIRRAPAERGAGRATIQDFVDAVSAADFEDRLLQLTSYFTRYSSSESYHDAAAWCQAELEGLGYSVSTQSITANGGDSINVIADKTGSISGDREVVLIVAHLDSINMAEVPDGSAPGADDNASGCAGLLHLAEVLATQDWRHDLRFILFGGEEQGMDGSNQYVTSLAADERAMIRAVINMDMIGRQNTAMRTVLLEGSPLSEDIIDELSDAAFAYTDLEVQTSLTPFGSDHLSFLSAEIPAVLTIEGNDSANSDVHTADDVVAHLDMSLALEIVRMNVAYAATKLEKHGGIAMAEFDMNLVKETVFDSMQDFFETGDFTKYKKLSGRYHYNKGATSRSLGARLASREISTVSRADKPTYTDMIQVEDDINAQIASSTTEIDWSQLQKLRFTLHIDIDGIDPLNVVSGTVYKGLMLLPLPHFIGRVTSNTLAPGERNLVVEDFNFDWPGTTTTIDRLEITLTGITWGETVNASVTFMSGARGMSYGPYSVAQDSTYFRDVEVEVDKEDHAAEVEPYRTDTHPDRPADMGSGRLTLENVFGRAGIRITRTEESNVIDSAEALANGIPNWSDQEMHDAMEDHWSAFMNRPQWKMWIFLAELYEDSDTGGVMFDAFIDEPGGVDRQGTAVFTTCPFYHSSTGAYIEDNPPVDQAVKRELFFNYIHEAGHAYNLFHSFIKTAHEEWVHPSWMRPLSSNDCALSWMNYPERATQRCAGGTDYNATWFYENFYFRFDDNENLFLRHAPQSYVQHGASEWETNHGRVSEKSLDRKLQLTVRNRKKIVDLGESVFVELKLRNVGDLDVPVQQNLDPSDGMVELAVTTPRGERIPFIPFMHTRRRVNITMLEPGQSVYHSVNLTMGRFGFSFKEPGAYRIEACYRNVNGKTAAAVMQMWVRPPANYDDMPVISELFNARVGRVLMVGGSRTMEDVNDKIDWVSANLPKGHPAQFHFQATRALPYRRGFKTLRADSDKLRCLDADPDEVVKRLTPWVEKMDMAADSSGHIELKRIVDSYTQAALDADHKAKAVKAQSDMHKLFVKREVLASTVEAVEARVRELKGMKKAKPKAKEKAAKEAEPAM